MLIGVINICVCFCAFFKYNYKHNLAYVYVLCAYVEYDNECVYGRGCGCGYGSVCVCVCVCVYSCETVYCICIVCALECMNIYDYRFIFSLLKIFECFVSFIKGNKLLRAWNWPCNYRVWTPVNFNE